MAVAYFKILSQFSSGGTEENCKSLNQHRQWTGQDSDFKSAGCKKYYCMSQLAETGWVISTLHAEE